MTAGKRFARSGRAPGCAGRFGLLPVIPANGAGRLAGLVVWLGLLLGLVPGCRLDQDEAILMAAGSYGDLAVVVSSDGIQSSLAPFLERLNRPVTFVIKPEPPFKIDVFGPRKWKLCKGYRNILFLLRWGDGGPVAKKVAGLLSPANRERIRRGDDCLLQMENPFARYQFALVVAANDRNALASLLSRNVDRIRDLIEQASRQRIQRRFRREGLHDDLPARYRQRYGFQIDLPLVYRENQVEPGGFAGLEWVRNAPTRGITIAWRHASGADSTLADRDALLAWRQRIGNVMHHEEIVPESVHWRPVTLAGRSALRLSGAWASKTIEGGGPFRCYFLFDPGRQRLLCLDSLVYAPGLDKMPFFREMQAILETFSLLPAGE